MKRILTMGLAVMLGAFGAACADEPAEDMALEEPLVQEPIAAEPAAPSMDQQLEGTALRVDSLQGGELYLTDGSGRALYLLEGEPEGQSTCYDACAEEWPPFLASDGPPTAEAPALQAGLVGTLQRRDGSMQVTYAGHALYYYHDDQGPGQTTGQDVSDQWGEWYLVQPSGDALEE